MTPNPSIERTRSGSAEIVARMKCNAIRGKTSSITLRFIAATSNYSRCDYFLGIARSLLDIASHGICLGDALCDWSPWGAMHCAPCKGCAY